MQKLEKKSLEEEVEVRTSRLTRKTGLAQLLKHVITVILAKSRCRA